MFKNYGLIDVPPHQKDYRLGSIQRDINLESGNWSAFLPKLEIQRTTTYDTYACVTFSALNCLETLLNYRFGAEMNLSDRFTAKISGTIPGRGNYFGKVAHSIRHDGVLLESQYPFAGDTVKKYYAEIPENTPERDSKGFVSLRKEAQIFAKSLNIEYEWVDYGGVTNDSLRASLKSSPVQVSYKTGGKRVDGVYQNVQGQPNHAVMLYKMDKKGNKWIYDHYENSIKKLAPNVYIGAALQYHVAKKIGVTTFVRLFKEKFGAYSWKGRTNTHYWLEYEKTGTLPF